MAKYRIVIRTIDQRTAIRLMEQIVPDVVDSLKFPGVKSAKVICADAYEAGRKDLILIYVDDRDTMAAVVNVILGYRNRFGEQSFRDPLPVGIERLARGLGSACQPPESAVFLGAGGPSYGDNWMHAEI